MRLGRGLATGYRRKPPINQLPISQADIAIITASFDYRWASIALEIVEIKFNEYRPRKWLLILATLSIQCAIALGPALHAGFINPIDLRTLMARNIDVDPSVLPLSKIFGYFGRQGLRAELNFHFSNDYASDYITLLLDLFLVFIFV